jgi:DNA-directed RNA polymerase subunit delta
LSKKTVATKEKEMPMVNLAYEILNKKKKPLPFSEIMKQTSKKKNLSDGEFEEQIARLYTNLNIDGRFLSLGDSKWGLRDWYPVDQREEEYVAPKKRKKKKKKKEKEEEEIIEDDTLGEEDDFEELGEESDKNKGGQKYDEDDD